MFPQQIVIHKQAEEQYTKYIYIYVHTHTHTHLPWTTVNH